jgi:voltage-gated potassium channel Kch
MANDGRSPINSKRDRAPKYSLRQRVGYWFDSALSRGPSVVIGWLGLLTLFVILVAAVILAITRLTGVNGGDDDLGFAEAVWQSMLRVVDAGTFAGDNGWWTRLLGLVVTLAGIFIAGSLIGLIANAVDQRIELLRKGRSAVLEHRHTLILGWSDRVPAIVGELVLANESLKRAAVVVLADVDKVMMEETLRDSVGDFLTTKLVCRSGNTATFADLGLVNVQGARSIVVIGGNDATVVKTLLALKHLGTAPAAPIVAEVNDDDFARSIRSLFGEQVVIVNSDAVVAELTAQACRQRGLSQVFRELLDFDGDEIYFEGFPALVGTTFREAQLRFEHSSLMGVLNVAGEVMLNPAPDSVIGPDDQLIGIASDDSTFVCTDVIAAANVSALSGADSLVAAPRRIVLVGWSQLGPRVVSELDEFLGAETTLEIIVDPDVIDPEAVRNSIDPQSISVEINTVTGRPEQIARQAATRAFHEVIVLGRRQGISAEEADAATLLTLMAFNQLPNASEFAHVRIVAELLEQRHAPLAIASGVDDFIVSDELTSLMMAQLSEHSALDLVFRDLFDQGGATIEMVPAERYASAGVTTFADVVAAASKHGQCALGYRRDSTGDLIVNPAKSESLDFGAGDTIVVLR